MKTIKTYLKNTSLSNLFYSIFQSMQKGFSSLGFSIKGMFPSSNIYFLPISIYVFKALEALAKILFPSQTFISQNYLEPFIEKFGIVYGILLPLILVKAWEQLKDFDQLVAREANAIKTLYSGVFYLRGRNIRYVKEITAALRKYVVHVICNYTFEIKNHQYNIKRQDDEKIKGDRILEETREKISDLIRINGLRTKEEEILIPKLIDQLNKVIDIREDRIGIASRRIFESLHFIALIASIIFVLPFYFESFVTGSSLLDNLLTIGVTLLTVIIYILIEDFDEPFDGVFKISIEPWHRILQDIDSPKRKLELEKPGKPERKKNNSRHTAV